MSRRAASEKAGLNATYIRDIVTGRNRNPRSEHLARLALVLKTSMEWLLEGRGEEEPTAEQLEFERIQNLVRRIAPEDLPQAERALRGFVRDAEQLDFKAESPAASKRKLKP